MKWKRQCEGYIVTGICDWEMKMRQAVTVQREVSVRFRFRANTWEWKILIRWICGIPSNLKSTSFEDVCWRGVSRRCPIGTLAFKGTAKEKEIPRLINPRGIGPLTTQISLYRCSGFTQAMDQLFLHRKKYTEMVSIAELHEVIKWSASNSIQNRDRAKGKC